MGSGVVDRADLSVRKHSLVSPMHVGFSPLKGVKKTRHDLPSQPIADRSLNGAEALTGDSCERYREKIARITFDSRVQFAGLLDAKGNVLEITQVALDAVGKPFWDAFWWQVSEEINATLRESIRRAAQGEFVRWETEIYGRAGLGKPSSSTPR